MRPTETGTTTRPRARPRPRRTRETVVGATLVVARVGDPAVCGPPSRATTTRRPGRAVAPTADERRETVVGATLVVARVGDPAVCGPPSRATTTRRPGRAVAPTADQRRETVVGATLVVARIGDPAVFHRAGRPQDPAVCGPPSRATTTRSPRCAVAPTVKMGHARSGPRSSAEIRVRSGCRPARAAPPTARRVATGPTMPTRSPPRGAAGRRAPRSPFRRTG